MGYDIFGDVHGHADRLEALLSRLDYKHHKGAWRHPQRTAIFVGDFIDRGPGQLRTLRLVDEMLNAGSALAVMGNHEFNAIGWASPDRERPGVFLRPRAGSKGAKNAHQHSAFLLEVIEDSAEHRGWVDWFLDLPLWIELPELRVVHACWDAGQAAAAQPWLRDGTRLTRESLPDAHQRGHPLSEAVEVLLKGPEVPLPPGYSFTDKDGHERRAIRTRWWDPTLATYKEAYVGPPGASLPDLPVPAAGRVTPPDRPTFIGHYWLSGSRPTPLTDKVACVDYSVANGGQLAAYRFDGEKRLRADKFVTA